MLNNKKSFLQKARIAMVAIVTIMGLGGAFAMKAPVNKDVQTWGIVATVGNSYQVATLSSGNCDLSETPHCEFQTSATPDGDMLVPISSGSIVQTAKGDFQQ